MPNEKQRRISVDQKIVMKYYIDISENNYTYIMYFS